MYLHTFSKKSTLKSTFSKETQIDYKSKPWDLM